MSVYAISDIHGQYSIWEQAKEILKPEDTLYVLGDCGDRGKDGGKIILEALHNPQVKYIKGNHEDILYDALMKPVWHNVNLLFCNGGESTFDYFINWGVEDKTAFCKEINNLPLHLVYKNTKGQQIHMTHAGFSYNEDSSPRNLLWDRFHFQYFDKNIPEDVYILHGHTPIESLIKFIKRDYQWNGESAFFYNNGHKIDIDTGTYRTNKSILFNLDTFESIILSVKE